MSVPHALQDALPVLETPPEPGGRYCTGLATRPQQICAHFREEQRGQAARDTRTWDQMLGFTPEQFKTSCSAERRKYWLCTAKQVDARLGTCRGGHRWTDTANVSGQVDARITVDTVLDELSLRPQLASCWAIWIGPPHGARRDISVHFKSVDNRSHKGLHVGAKAYAAVFTKVLRDMGGTVDAEMSRRRSRPLDHEHLHPLSLYAPRGAVPKTDFQLSGIEPSPVRLLLRTVADGPARPSGREHAPADKQAIDNSLAGEHGGQLVHASQHHPQFATTDTGARHGHSQNPRPAAAHAHDGAD